MVQLLPRASNIARHTRDGGRSCRSHLEFGGIGGIISSWSSRMTQEDQDKIVGQTRREYREAKQELAALTSKARKLGERMVQIGNVLTNAPENLIFHGESHDGRFSPILQPMPVVEEFRELQTLLPFTNHIRETLIKVDKLRQELTRLEGEDPEGGQSAHSPYSPPTRPSW